MFFRPELMNIGGHQIIVQIDVEANITMPHILFDYDLVKTKILNTGATVLLICK